jgi:hypothetical protein
MGVLDYWVLNRAHRNIFHNLSNIGQKPLPRQHKVKFKAEGGKPRQYEN